MKKKIVLARSHVSPLNPNVFSGSAIRIYDSLTKYYSVDVITVTDSALTRGLYAIEYFLSMITSKNNVPLFYLNTLCAKHLSNKLMKKIRKMDNVDALFILGADSIFDIKLNIPIIYFTDGLFAKMINYYWNNIPKHQIKSGNIIQQKALNNSSVTIVSSNWAKKSIIEDYGVSEEKIRVVLFGANHPCKHIPKLKTITQDEIKILFIGKDWKRKGLEIAIDCINILNERNDGFCYHLDVVGGSTSTYQSTKNIIIHGFIDDNNMNDLLSTAHLFILPTHAECSAISFCEASSYGLPIITYDTGGTSNYVINDKNGYALPLSANANDFANIIQNIVSNPSEYSRLSKGSRELYEAELNWDKWSETIKFIIDELIDKQTGSHE